VPRIRWSGLPPALRDHLFERVRERRSPQKICTSSKPGENRIQTLRRGFGTRTSVHSKSAATDNTRRRSCSRGKQPKGKSSESLGQATTEQALNILRRTPGIRFPSELPARRTREFCKKSGAIPHLSLRRIRSPDRETRSAPRPQSALRRNGRPFAVLLRSDVELHSSIRTCLWKSKRTRSSSIHYGSRSAPYREHCSVHQLRLLLRDALRSGSA
jgi:hypothetical protein